MRPVVANTVRLLGAGAEGEQLPLDLRGALLAYLAYAGGWVVREQVAFLLWPDTDEAGARRNLRQLINRTKALPLSTPLEIEAARLRWPVGSDVAELRRAVGRQQWARVAALYRGDLLAGRPMGANPGFNAWLDLERENLRNAYRRALERRAEELALQRDHAEAALTLEPLLQGEELEEEPLQAYMRSAYLAGQRPLALRAYERFAQRLARELDMQPLDETVHLYRTIKDAAPLAGTAPAAAPAAPLQVQRPPQLVGREEALAKVNGAGTPVVLLSGEAGVGKTRLLEELTGGAPGARCLEGLQSVPFQGVGDLVRQALRNGWDAAELGDYQEDLARLVPEVLPGIMPAPAEPLTTRSRLLEALARCLESAYGQSRPPGGASFGVTIDDLQWADEGTLELLTLLAHRGAVRVLGAYRRYETTEPLKRFLASLTSAGLLTVVNLEPLDEEHVRRLLATLIGVPEGPERFARWLHGSSAGNVMFALETLRSMFDGGVLQVGADGWKSDLDAITRDYSELEAPRAIADVVGRRLDRLSGSGVRAAQAAAVLGAGFTPELLAAMLDCSELAAQDALEELESGGIVTGQQFRHDLIRQATYAGQAPDRRRLLHARAAQALTPSSHTVLDGDSLIVVAEHQLAAGDPLAGARTLSSAATNLYEVGLVPQALSVLERSLVRLQQGEAGMVSAGTGSAGAGSAGAGYDPGPGVPQDHPSVTRIRISLARGLIMLGQLDKAGQIIDGVLSGTPPADIQAEALETQSNLLLRSGKLEEAGAAARVASELAHQSGERTVATNASTLLAEALFHQGRLDEALDIVDANIQRLRTEDTPLPLASQLTSKGAVLDELQRSDEALAVHLEALQISRALGARHQFVNVALNLLECYRTLGRPQDALTVAQEALALGEVDGTSVLRNNLASMLMELDRLPEAAKHVQPNLEVEDPTIRALAWARLIRIHALLGNDQEVQAALAGTLEHAPLTDYPVARVAAAASLFDHGEEPHRQAALRLIEKLDPDALEGDDRADVLRIRQVFAGG